MCYDIVEFLLDYRLQKPTHTQRTLASKYRNILRVASIDKLFWDQVEGTNQFRKSQSGELYWKGSQTEYRQFMRDLVLVKRKAK